MNDNIRVQVVISKLLNGNPPPAVWRGRKRLERGYNERHRPPRQVGRVGHGLRNTGGLSVFPTNHTVLEPNMIISVEPMTSTVFGWITVQEQYVVTDGRRDTPRARA